MCSHPGAMQYCRGARTMPRPHLNFDHLAADSQQLLAFAKNQRLGEARLTQAGIEMKFEDDDERVELLIRPKVYSEGRVIVDPINDLGMVVKSRHFRRDPEKDSWLLS